MTIIASGQLTLTDMNDAIVSGSPPSNPTVGTLWIDTSVSPNILKVNDGSAWVTQTLGLSGLDPTSAKAITTAQTTANSKNKIFYGQDEPSDANKDDVWFKVVDGEYTRTYRFDGIQWQLVVDADVSAADQAAQAAQAAAEEAKATAANAEAVGQAAQQTAADAEAKGDAAAKAAEEAKDAATKAQADAASAVTSANNAVNTANKATQDAQDAIDKAQDGFDAAQDALSKAGTAVDTANTAKQVASDAATQASTAKTNAQTAMSNAQDAINKANAANANANTREKSIIKSNTAPSNPATDQLWIDTSKTPQIMRRWNGSTWVDLSPTQANQIGAVSTTTYTTDISNINNTLSQKASATTVNTLTGRVDKAETAISQNASDIALKADKSYVDTIKNTVDNHSTLISQNADAIALKASQSTVDALTGRVSTAEATLTAQADQIAARITKTDADAKYATQTALTATANSLTSNISAVQTNLDNLQIGGRNYWVLSSLANGFIGSDGGVIYTGLDKNIPLTPIPNGFKSIILTIYDHIESPGNACLLFYDANESPVGTYYYSGNPMFSDDGNYPKSAIKSIPSNAVYFRASFYNPDGKKIKVEFGSKPTDWSPAPEDMATVVQFNTLQQTLDSTVSRIGNAEGNISALQQTANSFATRISNAEGSISTLTQTTSGLQSTVSNINSQVNWKENWEPDLNNITTTGKYFLKGQLINSPVSSWAYLTVESFSNGRILQTIRHDQDTLNWQRFKFDDKWSDWIRLADSDDINNINNQFSSVTQTINGIQTRVGNAEGSINTLTQTATSLQSTIEKIGQSNLVYNSDLQSSADGWWFSNPEHIYRSTAVTDIYNGTYGIVCNFSNNPNTNDVWDSAVSKTIPAKKGDVFSASVSCFIWAGWDDPNNAFHLTIEGKDASGNRTEWLDTWADKSIGYNRQTLKIENYTVQNDQTVTVNINLGIKRNGGITYNCPMLIRGTTVGQYMPDGIDKSIISQLVDDINLRVSKNDVINQINISSEGILIDGRKVHITGQTTIDNAVIKDAMIQSMTANKLTAGTIDANVITVKNINASNIVTGTLDASKATVTNIDASKITTGTLNAARIAAGSIDASKLAAGTITAASGVIGSLDASKITTGTLDAAKVNVVNLNADNINSGTLDAININGSVIQSSSFYAHGSQPQIDGTTKDVQVGINGNWRWPVHIDVNFGQPGSYFHASNDQLNIGYFDGSSYDDKIKLNNTQSIASAIIDTVNISSNGYWGNIDGVTGITMKGTSDSYTNLYIGVGKNGKGELRIATASSVGTNDINYADARALHWYTPSLIEYKTDISPMTESALDIINATDINKYRFKTDVAEGIDHINYGMIIGGGYRTPEQFMDKLKEGIDIYGAVSISIKAIQELSTQNNTHQEQITNLIMKIADLEARLAKLEA